MGDGTLAGWASVDITPRPPVEMGGYAARTGPANSMHDPLLALALAVGSRSEPLIVVVCDLVAVDAGLVEQVSDGVRRALPAANVWVAATHTHSGPDIGLGSGSAGISAQVLRGIADGALHAALEAVSTMRPVRGGWVSTAIDGIATNRDHPGSGEELTLDLLCLFDADGSRVPCAILGSFPCHPTVLGAANLALSADLPGAFRRGMIRGLGSDTWVALATGAGGDISTRHTRRGQGFDELERLGTSLADQALAALEQVQPIELGPLRVQQRMTRLPGRVPRSVQELQSLRGPLVERQAAALAAGDTGLARTLETTLQGLAAGSRRAGATQSIDALVNVAWLGEVALAAIPGELYNALGMALRHTLQCRALVLAYTNGYLGYIPTRDAYNSLDYEVLMTPLASGAGEQLRDTALELLVGARGG